jgi:hypothetical protein
MISVVPADGSISFPVRFAAGIMYRPGRNCAGEDPDQSTTGFNDSHFSTRLRVRRADLGRVAIAKERDETTE